MTNPTPADSVDEECRGNNSEQDVKDSPHRARRNDSLKPMFSGSVLRSAAARFPRGVYFTAGFVVAAFSFWFLTYWFDFFNTVLGFEVVFDTRPSWLRALMGVVAWLPWVTLAAVVAARIWLGRHIRALAFAIGLGVHQAAVVGWLFAAPGIDEALHRRGFDSSAWRTNDQTNVMWPARLAMVDDLLERHELRGMSREEITALLGPRDDTPYFRDWDVVYWLGPERGLFRIDSEWLVLRFGFDGRVQEYQVVRD